MTQTSRSYRSRTTRASLALVVVVVASASVAAFIWVSGRTSDDAVVSASRPDVGLAPPDPSRAPETHGTIPESEVERDAGERDGTRPIPLPLGALVPQTRGTWPNVRVDSAVFAPEETAIVIDPLDPDRIIAVAQGSGCYYFYSDDGGVTWAEDRITDPFDLGDPTITMAADGTAYYAYIGTYSHPGIFVARSTTSGVSWQPGTAIIENSNGAPFEDKETPICDLTAGPHAGSVYVGWTQFDDYGSPSSADSSRILFSYSRDQAATFSPPVRISDRGGDCIDRDDTVEGAVPAVGPDGNVYMAWVGPRGIEFDRSTDGGVTWGADEIISDVPGGWDFDVPGIYRANGLPQTVADFTDGPYSGRIYVLWSDQRNGDTDIFLLHSDDGGTSWSPRKRVNGDPLGNGRHQFFPWMSLDPETGHLYVVFYDRRETTGNATEVWIAVSTDGGASFSEEAVSQSPFTPSASVFFGDYIGIAARGGRVRPFWMRLDGNQMSVWTALVEFDLTGIVDGADFDDLGGVSDLGPRPRLAVLPNPTSTETRIFAQGREDGLAVAGDGPAGRAVGGEGLAVGGVAGPFGAPGVSSAPGSSGALGASGASGSSSAPGAPGAAGSSDLIGQTVPGPLRIFAADGRLVRSWSTAPSPGSADFVSWDLRDDRGRRVPSGSYWATTPDGATARIVVTR